MQVDWEKISGNNNSTRMHTISEVLASLESFISVRTSVQQEKKMITSLFGAEADAIKQGKLHLQTNQPSKWKQFLFLIESEQKTSPSEHGTSPSMSHKKKCAQHLLNLG